MSPSREIRAAALQVGQHLRVVFGESGYQLGGPADWVMEVTAKFVAGAGVTIRFAGGDHHGQLTLDAGAAVWVLAAP